MSGVPKHPSKVKLPMAANLPAVARAPRALYVDDGSIQNRCPVWRFADLDPHWPQAATELSIDQFRDLHTKLGAYETQKLSEIWHPGSQCHMYLVNDLPDAAFARLSELDRDDETAIHTLRVTGRFRVLGILREHIFYVLWIDPDHEIWPSKKKHT